MKKILSLGFVGLAVLFSGCTAEKAEVLYKVGKEVVILNSDVISPDKMEELKKIDATAKRIKIAKDLSKSVKQSEEDAKPSSTATK